MTDDAPFVFPTGPIGHEYSGEIVEVGRNVTALRVGQRVACKPGAPCGECESCRRGCPVACTSPRLNGAGKGGLGGFGEFVAINPGNVTALPASLSFADGALIEPMSCGIHALRLARMQPGDRILVLGAGSMALALIYWARRLGAGRIVAASRSTRHRDIVCSMGADALYALAETESAELFEALGGQPDIVAECVGKPGFIAQAVGFVRPRGTVISMGMCMHTEPLVPALSTFREATLVFPITATSAEFAETARAFDDDDFHPEIMVNQVITLEQVPATIEAMRAGTSMGMKVHVDPFLGHS